MESWAYATTPTPVLAFLPSLLARKTNRPLHRSQKDGEQDAYEARLHEVLSDTGFSSSDTSSLKKTLRKLLTTTVEWQSSTKGEMETWEACNLLAGVGITKNRLTGAVLVQLRFDTKVRSQLLSPDRYARLSIEALTQLQSHASMALYEICARYVDNHGHKTARQHWRWWKPVLTGYAGDDSNAEYRFFKRDVLNKAISEINARTNIEVRGPIEHKERDNKTVAAIQFEVFLKGERKTREGLAPLHGITPKDLPVIGRAISAGINQNQAEELLRRHGQSPMSEAVDDLERRLKMPTEVVGEVRQPANWLKDNLARKARLAKAAAASPIAKQVTADELNKRKAAWTETWLHSRKADLLNGFTELAPMEQERILTEFRDELEANQKHFLKRFDTSGWNHVMIRETFVKFVGAQLIGPDWFKPSADDILAVAASVG